jgi:GST-like protein
MLYLSEKFGGAFIPRDPRQRTEMFSWLFWQMGSAPFVGGGFGHFYAYAPTKQEYPINRYAMETKRQLDVLDRHLATHEWMAGEYSLADMAIHAWYGNLVLGRAYNAAEFLDVTSYTHVVAWAQRIDARPAVIRGRMVNRSWGEPAEQMPERHSAADFVRR